MCLPLLYLPVMLSHEGQWLSPRQRRLRVNLKLLVKKIEVALVPSLLPPPVPCVGGNGGGRAGAFTWVQLRMCSLSFSEPAPRNYLIAGISY